MIHILDYGLGNVGSISNMLRWIGCEVTVASSPESLLGASKIIVPGVGSFDTAMGMLEKSGFREALDLKVKEERVPILGICLGMQLFALTSEEGVARGLGYIDSHFKRFSPDHENRRLLVPHMGWSQVKITQPHALTHGLSDEARFYFVHSYWGSCHDAENVILTCQHGVTFAAAFASGNVMGVQFHPEKSHRFGMKLLHNFAMLTL